MTSNLDKYKADLDRLIKTGDRMLLDLNSRHLLENKKLPAEKKEALEKLNRTFEREYQGWFTESHAVIRQLIPNRLAEFDDLYKGGGKKKDSAVQNYHIQD